jgi:hypothetical protein
MLENAMKRLMPVAVAVGLLVSGPALAGKIKTDFNPKADFASYKTWDWVPGHDEGHRGILAGNAARGLVESALTADLERVGLRRVSAGEAPDLVVRYVGEVSDAAKGTTSGYLGGYEPYIMGEWSQGFQTALNVSEKSATMMVDLIDPGTKMLVWRAFIEQKYGSTASQIGSPVADAVRKAFEDYPPSESARQRKLREWEKRDKAK